ncbi:TPA: UbiD family decarboxylase [Candidatus Bathyarchaeota archaeon]|nr:UbiD family decarboxylase [Candidatus Bathyarchaeota archaeon]
MSDLRAFLKTLEKEDDIIKIKESMSPKREMAAALQRFDAGKAVMFEKVEGFDVKVVGGVCGTRGRILQGLGIEAKDLYPRLQKAIKNPMKCEVVKKGPVLEVVEEGDLTKIPVLTHFDGDPGPFITSGILYAKSPDGKVENVSFHRLMVLDGRRMTIRIVPRHLHRLTQLARQAGVKALDCCVSIGLHPNVLLAASLPAGWGVREYDIANNLLDGELKLVKCPHVDALAPADAELVLECKIRLDEDTDEGPFVDLSGTFDVKRKQPIVEVVGVMHRKDYIYQGLLPAGSEHMLLMGMPPEVRIWEYCMNIVPTVKGVNMTLGGNGWLHCVVSFDKVREGDPKNVLMAMFAAHPSLKHAVVVDGDIDPTNMREVEWAMATRFKGDEDLLIVPGVRVSSLDPTADQQTELGCKVGFDATRPLGKPKEKFMKAEITVTDRVKKILDKYE